MHLRALVPAFLVPGTLLFLSGCVGEVAEAPADEPELEPPIISAPVEERETVSDRDRADVMDEDGDGFTSDQDCDDLDHSIHPYASELCDGLDNNCDGQVDESTAVDALEWYPDEDQDGYGDHSRSIRSCVPLAGRVTVGGDCRDNDEQFNPGRLELFCMDPNDYNCDGHVGYVDADNDGYAACEECNDADPDSHPHAIEICDGIDNDCDGRIDDEDDNLDLSSATQWYGDADHDGYGHPNTATALSCVAPLGMVALSGDCDESDPLVSPGVAFSCPGPRDSVGAE